MLIHEAVKEALHQGKGLARKNWDESWLYTTIFPTNSSECCIVTNRSAQRSHPRWNPTADDLMADDWKVVGTSDLEA